MLSIVWKAVWKNFDGLSLGVILPLLFTFAIFSAIGIEAYSLFFAACMLAVTLFPLGILIEDVRCELERVTEGKGTQK